MLSCVHDRIQVNDFAQRCKSDDWAWNPVHTPYDEEYMNSCYKYVEPETGRRYTLGDITGPGGAAKRNPSYEVMGVTRYWR